MDPAPAVPESASARPDASPVKRSIVPWGLLIAIGLLSSVPTLCALAARHSWFCELCVHFRAYYAGGFLLGTVIFLIGRKWKWAVLWTVVFAWNAAGLVPFYFGAKGEGSRGDKRPVIKLLSANVNSRNRDFQRLIDLVRKEKPDVLLAIEVDADWVGALAVLEADYPHVMMRPRSDNFGIACYSRVPTVLMEVKKFDSTSVPSIVVRLDHEHGDVTIVGTHPLPPMTANFAELRDRQLASIAAFVREQPGPLIVAGDLNTTSWSPCFQDLLDSTGLRDSRRGLGIQPSWVGAGAIWIPIDHVLISPQLDVLDRHIGDDIGSDHYPVIAEVRVR